MRAKILIGIILVFFVFPISAIGQTDFNLPKPGLTPDSPFYFFDTIGKKISLFFTFSPEKKAEKAIQFAEERLAEAKIMGEENKTKALASANQAYQEYLSLANLKTKEAKEKGKDVEELAILITEKTLKHQEVLIEVFEKVPEEAKAAIENAIQISRRGSEDAVQAVTGVKKDELLQKIEETQTKAEEKIAAMEERIKILEEQLGTKVMETEARAEKLRREAEVAKEEAEKAKLLAEAEKAKLEAEKAKLETEKLRKELEQTQKLTTEKKEVTKTVELSIEGVTPNQILNNIDNYLTITGTGIQNGAEVIIAGVSFGSGNVIDNKTITIKISSGTLTPNTYSIQVVNPDGKTDILYNSLTITKPQPITPAELTTQEITAKLSPAVILLFNNVEVSSGSGVIIDNSGYVLTNEHVIRGDSVIDVILYDGTILSGSVVGWNQSYDLAVIKLNGGNFNYASLGDSNSVNLGEEVMAFGYPLIFILNTETITVTKGIISAETTIKNGIKSFQTDATIHPGNSGGPLVRRKNGEIIGINTACIQIGGVCASGLNFAIKINEAKSILSDLKAGVKVSIPQQTPTPDSTPIDTNPPVVSNINIPNLGTNSATINWTTNEPSTSQIWYGKTTTAGDLTPLNSSLVTSHGVSLSNLTNNTTYYYKVISKDASGNETISSIQNFFTEAATPGSLTVAMAATPAASTFVKNTTGNTVATIRFTAGSNEDVRITAIKIAGDSNNNFASSGSDGLASRSGNIKLYDGSNLIANAVPTLTTGSNYDSAQFSSLDLIVPKGGTKAVDVKIDVLDSSGSLYYFGIADNADITASGVNSGVSINPSGAPVAGQPMTFSPTGTLTMAADASMPISAQIIAGSTGIELAKIKFTATVESMKIHKIKFTLADDSAASFGKLTLSVGGTLKATAYLGASLANEAVFNFPIGFELDVAKGNTVVTLKADFPDYTQIISGSVLKIGIADPSDVTATGATSGNAVTVNGSAVMSNPMYIYRTKPVVSLNASSPSGTQPVGTRKEVFRFDISNPSPLLDLTINSIKFTIGTNATSAAFDRAYNLYKSTDLVNSLGAAVSWAQNTTTAATGYVTITSGNIVAAASNNTYVVYGDTSVMNRTTGSDTLTLSIEEGDFYWDDGSGINDNKKVLNLPVRGNTLTY